MLQAYSKPLFVDTPRYDLWVKVAMGAVLAITLLPGLWLLMNGHGWGWYLLSVALAYVAVFYSIMPRRFELYEDRLLIIIGRPFSISMPLERLQRVRTSENSLVFAYRGIRLATSTRNVVELESADGLNIVISPKNATVFVEQLTAARSAAQKQTVTPGY